MGLLSCLKALFGFGSKTPNAPTPAEASCVAATSEKPEKCEAASKPEPEKEACASATCEAQTCEAATCEAQTCCAGEKPADETTQCPESPCAECAPESNATTQKHSMRASDPHAGAFTPQHHAADARPCAFDPLKPIAGETLGVRKLGALEREILEAADNEEAHALYLSEARLAAEKIDDAKLLSAFVNDGLLTVAFRRERLTVMELRALAKHFGCKVSGRKAELLERLADQPDEALAAQNDKRILLLTDRGRQALAE